MIKSRSTLLRFLLCTTFAVSVGLSACSDGDEPTHRADTSGGVGGAAIGTGGAAIGIGGAAIGMGGAAMAGEAGARDSDSAGTGSEGGDPAGRGGSSSGASGGSSFEAGSAGSATAVARGAAGAGGASGAGDVPPFIIGADISSTQESNLTYVDVDGSEKPLLEVLKNHGFNYARLRTFVDPSAPHGYASSANGCPGLAESFGDRDHVIAFGKQIKQAGMGFLLDFHYSDVWADPGKQIIPQRWRDAGSLSELAEWMRAYTSDVITAAIAAGARPDMVQIGNEITGGLLKHVPGPATDCWGNGPLDAAIGGSTSHWDDLASLLKAGISAVREVDPSIQIMLHIENTDDLAGVRWWLDNALARNVDFDVLGLSCYPAYQGEPATWKTTLNDVAKRYPRLKLAIAEYNAERTQANLMVRALPDARGVGTFLWEPTRSGSWGTALFDIQDNIATASEGDFAEFDELRLTLDR